MLPKNAYSSEEEFIAALRDWFAGQALNGICAAFARVSRKAGESQAEAEARWSYERADAMLEARAAIAKARGL